MLTVMRLTPKKRRLMLCSSFQNFEIAPHPCGTPMILDPEIYRNNRKLLQKTATSIFGCRTLEIT